MEEDETESALKIAAAAKIFAKRAELYDAKDAIATAKSELGAREREVDRQIDECRAAAKFFGVEFEPFDGDPEIDEVRQRIRMWRYRATDNVARGIPAGQFERRVAELEIHLEVLIDRKKTAATFPHAWAGSLGRNAIVHGVPATQDLQISKPPKVRDLVLNRLRSIEPAGAKAASIRNYIETHNSLKMHEKTVGMTLFRLSKEGLVHRKGQTWFYAPQVGLLPPASAENPGAGAPGQTHEAG